MGWASNVFPLLIVTPTGGFTGLFLYSPGPGQGNLIGSWTSAAGTDPFGNPYPAGVNVLSGQLSNVAISALTETVNPGPLLLYGSEGYTITAFTTPGAGNWVAPAGLVGSAVDTVICTGAGGGGDAGDAGAGESGAGGGACSVLQNVAVTIGNTYHPTVGTGGAANTDGGASSFAGDALTVTANGGKGAVDPTVNPPGGAASTTPAGVVSFAGGAGGGSGGQPHGGGGGGGAASSIQAGNAGATGTSSAGGAGGAAAAGGLVAGGAGGTGGAPGGGNGSAGLVPGGGGGGGGDGGGTVAGTGANGQVVLIYRTSAAVSLLMSAAANAGTDPITGASYAQGLTSRENTFGSTTSFHGSIVTVVSPAGTWQLSGASLDLTTVGTGLRVAEGANAKQGTATLVAGTVLVNNTTVTANSRIFLTAQTTGAGPGALRVSARVAGTSFTITSSNAADTSLVAWEIFEPG